MARILSSWSSDDGFDQNEDGSMTDRKRSLLVPPVLILAAWAACVLLLPASAGAQTRDQVRDELRETDRLLERAHQFASDNDLPRGRAKVDTATQREKDAHDAFDRGDMHEAQRLTRDARAQLLDVSARARIRDRATDAVGDQIAATGRILEEEQERLRHTPDGAASRRLEAAQGIQEHARRLYDDGHLRPALQATLQAREMLPRTTEKPGRMGPGERGWGGPPMSEGRLEHIMERQNRAIERMTGRIDPTDGHAREQLASARRSHDAALAAMHDEQWNLAEQHFHEAQQALLSATVAVAHDLRAEEISVLIEDASRRHEDLARPVHDHGSPDLNRRWQQAGDDLTEARAALHAGELRRSLIQTRSALSLVDEISEELGR